MKVEAQGLAPTIKYAAQLYMNMFINNRAAYLKVEASPADEENISGC